MSTPSGWSNPPISPRFLLIIVTIASAAVWYFGGPLAWAIALLFMTPLAIANGFLTFRLILYQDGYLADLLPDGRGKHGRKRWRVGVVDAPPPPASRARGVQWITPKGGGE